MAAKIDRVGETRMMNCGMKATIIRYGKAIDIDVRFEDGTVVKHKSYSKFKKGGIAHLLISLKHGSRDFHGFICRQGFKDEDRVLYECICKDCGLEDVLTPQEMMEHKKLEHGEGKWGTGESWCLFKKSGGNSRLLVAEMKARL